MSSYTAPVSKPIDTSVVSDHFNDSDSLDYKKDNLAPNQTIQQPSPEEILYNYVLKEDNIIPIAV